MLVLDTVRLTVFSATDLAAAAAVQVQLRVSLSAAKVAVASSSGAPDYYDYN